MLKHSWPLTNRYGERVGVEWEDEYVLLERLIDEVMYLSKQVDDLKEEIKKLKAKQP